MNKNQTSRLEYGEHHRLKKLLTNQLFMHTKRKKPMVLVNRWESNPHYRKGEEYGSSGRSLCAPACSGVNAYGEFMAKTPRAVDSTLSSAESYTCIPEGRISKLCKHLSLLALGLGCAVARAHPRGLLRPRR